MFIPQNSPPYLSNRRSGVETVITGFPSQVSCICATGRAAMATALERSGVSGNIWLPAFICRSLPDYLLSRGFTVGYYDVDMSLMPVIDRIGFARGDALVVVHFFGIRKHLAGLKTFTHNSDILLVEDCAHILPDSSSDFPAGSDGDIAVFSLRKLLSVQGGGVACSTVRICDNRQQASSEKTGMKKTALNVVERMAFLTGINILPLKRLMRNHFGTTDSGTAPDNEDCRAPVTSGKPGHPNDPLQDIVRRRKANYAYLCDALRSCANLRIPFPELPDGSCPQVFPIVVDDPEKLGRILERRGIEADVWPGAEKVVHAPGRFPGAEFWLCNLLILPVNQALGKRHLDFMAGMLADSH